MLSTSDVLRLTNISSPRTLDRYRELGLVQNPTIGTHASGRGKTASWPDDAPNRIRTIRELLTLGKALDATATLVQQTMSQWKAYQASKQLTEKETRAKPSSGSARSYKFAEASKHMDAEQALVDFILAVEKYLREEGANFADPTTLANGWHNYVTRNHACEVLRLVEEGINPVLAFDGKLVRVVADFVVAERVAEMKATATPLLVLPISGDLRSVLAKITPRATSASMVAFQSKVIDNSTGRTFRCKDGWDFDCDSS